MPIRIKRGPGLDRKKVPLIVVGNSFDTRTLAKKWARGIERKHDIGDFSD